MSVAARTVDHAWRVSFALATLALSSCGTNLPSDEEPPIAREVAYEPQTKWLTPAEASPAARACEPCHAEIADEWDRSAHHHSASDPSYVAALAREPLAFCRGCHAPSADSKLATPPRAVERGTACTDCHVSVPRDHGSGTTAMPPARACAGCHEFRFPNSSLLMQRTEREHAGSAYADTACADCHMPPRARRHRSHRFEVSADLMRSALEADVARAGPTRVAFRLRPAMVGHAFPTGDLFRRLVVRAEVLDDDDRVVGRSERYLHRWFTSTAPRAELKDDRVGAALEPCFELDVGKPGRVRVEIAHERVDSPRSSHDDDAAVSARTVVYESVIGEGERPCR